MYGHRSEKRTIPISGSLALRWPASDRNNPAACAEASACEAQWAQGIAGAQPKPKILFTKVQESQYRPPHTEGVARKQPACALGSRSFWPRLQPIPLLAAPQWPKLRLS